MGGSACGGLENRMVACLALTLFGFKDKISVPNDINKDDEDG
jgi:hypothetical protein